MYVKEKIYCSLLLVSFCFFLNAQTTPSNDNAWILKHNNTFDSSLTDLEFGYFYNYWNVGAMQHGNDDNCTFELDYKMPYNTEVLTDSNDNKYLASHIRKQHVKGLADKDASPDSIVCDGRRNERWFEWTGSIPISRRLFGGYGYMELDMKMPKGKGFWPAFWLFGGDPTGSCKYTREFDIVESSGAQSENATAYGTNFHFQYLDSKKGSCESNGSLLQKDINPGNKIYNFDRSAKWYKYGFEWGQGFLILYVNDIPVRRISHPSINLLPKHLIFGISASQYTPPSSSTPYFGTLCIDNVKWYKLSTANCNTPKLISKQSDVNTITSELYKYYLFVNGNNSKVYTSSDHMIRAVEYVTIGKGTTIVPDGSGSFTAMAYGACDN